MIGWAVVSHVNRNVATVGGTVSAISLISDSGIGPGPLGMRETRPMADAPLATASAASAGEAMQQIFTLGGIGNTTGSVVGIISGNCIQFSEDDAHETHQATPESGGGDVPCRMHGQRNLQPQSGLVRQLHIDGVRREERSRDLHLPAWGSGLSEWRNVRGE